ncbi:hypothetical protein NDU88_002147 [Pleurodeles waltl]|uniref:Uncharacterized protein n=1 Tax=Pleurodeles waltl TaxID=8319 RepID=A0AAV7TKY6_PLEWA|nr:hypothetical protein NDU88_002147 [Pleurodeles waltl]
MAKWRPANTAARPRATDHLKKCPPSPAPATQGGRGPAGLQPRSRQRSKSKASSMGRAAAPPLPKLQARGCRTSRPHAATGPKPRRTPTAPRSAVRPDRRSDLRRGGQRRPPQTPKTTTGVTQQAHEAWKLRARRRPRPCPGRRTGHP